MPQTADTFEPGNTEDILTQTGAAEYLTVLRGIKTTESRLSQWRHYGRGPDFFKRGKLIFYRREDLEAWAKKEATPDNPKSRQRQTSYEAGGGRYLVVAVRLKSAATRRDGVFRLPAGRLVGMWRTEPGQEIARKVEVQKVRSIKAFWETKTAGVVAVERRGEILVRVEDEKGNRVKNLVAMIRKKAG